jgi:hypothetical protein
MNLDIENIRCFAGRHSVPIKPLTLLLGENSSGKSTLMAVLAAVSDPLGFPFRPRFNDPPYNLGGFSTIATIPDKPAQRRSSRSPAKQTFSIGFSRTEAGAGPATVVANYDDDHGEPSLTEFRVSSIDGEAIARRTPSAAYSVSLNTEERARPIEFSVDASLASENGFDSRDILLKSIYSLGDPSNTLQWPGASLLARKIFTHLLLPATVSIAPIRTQPRRTYDRGADAPSPEGDHVPFLLFRMLLASGDSERGSVLGPALKRFGEESGLFDQVAIRSLGKTPGDPFQVIITIEERQVSLVDVGYGVSQALPVIVQSIVAPKDSRLLIQQPEVHLHPKAQAALGSFFVDLVLSTKKSLVVETHSDYVTDRVRQEVAAGKIAPDDVVFLYFELKRGRTKVYPMTLDKLGNLNGAPPTYREFFLRETMNLLGAPVK